MLQNEGLERISNVGEKYEKSKKTQKRDHSDAQLGKIWLRLKEEGKRPVCERELS